MTTKMVKVPGGYAEEWKDCAHIVNNSTSGNLYIGYGVDTFMGENAVCVWFKPYEGDGASFIGLFARYAVQHILGAYLEWDRMPVNVVEVADGPVSVLTA